MPAYVITKIAIHDPAAFQAYIEASTATIRKFGGHHIARGAEADVLVRAEDNSFRNGITIQFAVSLRMMPGPAFDSPDYQEVRPNSEKTVPSWRLRRTPPAHLYAGRHGDA